MFSELWKRPEQEAKTGKKFIDIVSIFFGTTGSFWKRTGMSLSDRPHHSNMLTEFIIAKDES